MASFGIMRGIKCLTGNELLQNEITGLKLVFSMNFGGKLSFIPSFLFPERILCCYLYNYYNYSRTLCIKCRGSAFQLRFNNISLLCGYHSKEGIGGEREGDFMDNFTLLLHSGDLFLLFIHL
jgi:hypothetical protein